MTPSEEIKSKLDIIDVLREYITVKAAGVNFRAVCPFHNEKTPSLMISPDKQIWHCFGCGKGGDIFGFVMEMENITFVEALRLLAKKAGVVLRAQDPKAASQRNRLFDLLEAAAAFYHRNLLSAKDATAAQIYLAKRGLSEEMIEDWQIGFSRASWDDLLIFLKGKGFHDEEIFAAGLALKKNQGSGYYNRFRERIMFPLRDVNANTVGFTARVLPANDGKDGMGKYINSPQTVIYDKSRVVFGLDRAKTAIKQHDKVIVVEGQMDCLTAHQFGYKNCIATSGTAFTTGQIDLLKRYTTNLLLAFDMDQAGSMATDRSIIAALEADLNIKIINLPAGKDPDECIRSDKDGWEKALKQARPAMEYYFAKAEALLNLEEVNDRRILVKKLLPIIARLPNPIDQNFWRKKLAQKVEVQESYLQEAIDQAKSQINQDHRQPASAVKNQPLAPTSREQRLSENFLALIIKQPFWLQNALDHLTPQQLPDDACRGLYKNLLVYYNKNSENSFNYLDFRNWLKENQGEANFDYLPLLDKAALLAEKDYYDYDEDQAKAEILKIAQVLRNYYFDSRRNDLAKLIDATDPADKKKLNDLMRELNNLNQERSRQ